MATTDIRERARWEDAAWLERQAGDLRSGRASPTMMRLLAGLGLRPPKLGTIHQRFQDPANSLFGKRTPGCVSQHPSAPRPPSLHICHCPRRMVAGFVREDTSNSTFQCSNSVTPTVHMKPLQPRGKSRMEFLERGFSALGRIKVSRSRNSPNYPNSTVAYGTYLFTILDSSKFTS